MPSNSHRSKRGLTTVAILLAVGLVGWFAQPRGRGGQARPQQRNRPAKGRGENPKLYSYTVVATFPHDPQAFTQGLEFDQTCSKVPGGKKECHDILWESTGMNGDSSLREVALETGEVRRKKMLHEKHFAEGVTKFRNRLWQLTWQSSTMLSTADVDFDNSKEHATPLRDGWGICSDGRSLIISDSSETLVWVNPDTMAMERSVVVHDGDQPIKWVNEMEWVDGEIWANVWMTECIVRISPSDGAVVGWVNLSGLLAQERHARPQARIDVLNGIAWDGQRKRLFVTGKWWQKLYQVQLQEAPQTAEHLNQVRGLCIPRSNFQFGL
eukprot:CAMPEP_0206141564 /NCGR_PEP_ID=MMETSP1473-20131121/13375_1 /ASSEMBLY_ACC=CAM_ASM_001109 /TAXON_ID=1461547 /ORGANISM="Stichococcus sp, Strain RCC1054" /LENGTH=324 /DNA_ID=CAMNT_0053536179 /DNA_START=227 /DNA_END=1201 /DNA_ORIENTATION=+